MARQSIMRRGPGSYIGDGSLTFVENAVNDYEYGSMSAMPDGFGDGEFTLEIFFKCLSNGTYALGDVTGGGLAQRQLWSNSNPTRYGTSSWWFNGNFLLDGHNNSAFYDGTFSIQIANGRPRWLFGDGAAANALTGDLWGIQSTATDTVLDNAWHHLVCVRRWNGGSNADLELWLDGSLQDTQTTTSRTNMATTYWDGWSGFSTDDGWGWGSEKQAALNTISQWEDFKGQLGQIRFWSRALSSVECADAFNQVSGTESGLVEYYQFSEQSGSTVRGSKNGSTYAISLTNSPSWSTDRAVVS